MAPPLMSQASSGTSPVLQKRKGATRHLAAKATALLVKKKPRGWWLMVEKSKGKKLWWVTARRRRRVRLHLLRKLHKLCHRVARHQVTPLHMLHAFAVSLLSQADWLVLIMLVSILRVLAKVRHHNLCPPISHKLIVTHILFIPTPL